MEELNKSEIERLLKDPDYLLKKYFNDRKYCMSYEKDLCDGEIVNSHIISEKYMAFLEKNGHVYSPIPSSHHKDSYYEFKLKGKNQVCVINGFCKLHDNSLFESFEKNNFRGEYNQIFDITFRALCREYFQKLNLLNFCKRWKNGELRQIEKTRFLSSNDFENYYKQIQGSIKNLKFLYDQLKKYKYSGLKYILIETSKIPILATGVMFPICDADGNYIQKLNKKNLGFIYNTVTLDNKSYVLIATIMTLNNNVHKVFLESIAKLPEKERINYLLTYFFFTNDNIVMAPEWFDSLTFKFKQQLSNLMNLQFGRNSDPSGNNYLINFIETIDIKIFRSILKI